MQRHLLSFEIDAEGEQLFIHADPEGLRVLIRSLTRLLDHAENGRAEHDHILTEEWGGGELSSVLQGSDAAQRLIQHVKLYGWPTPEGPQAYEQ